MKLEELLNVIDEKESIWIIHRDYGERHSTHRIYAGLKREISGVDLGLKVICVRVLAGSQNLQPIMNIDVI